MGEATTLFKMVAVLGLFFLFVGVLPGQSTPSAWQDFTDNTQGTDFPVFSDPFPKEFLRTQLTAGNSTAVNTAEVTGCDFSGAPDYYITNCIYAPRTDESFATVNLTGSPVAAVVSVDLTPLPDLSGVEPVVTKLVIHIVCKATARVNVTATIQGFTSGPSSTEYCSTTTMQDVQVVWGERWANTWTALDGGGVDFTFTAEAATQVEVAYIQVDVYTETEEDCTAPTGAWFPWLDETACAIGRFFSTIYYGFLYVINGIVFAVQVVAHILYLIALLVAGFFQMLFYLYALPGTPTWAQIVVDVFVTATLVYIIFIIVKMVRGSGEG